MRAVLKPNVTISGLLSREQPSATLLAWRGGYFELVLSPFLPGELERVLAYPKLRARIPRSDAEAAVRWLSQGATAAADPPEASFVRSEDPADDTSSRSPNRSAPRSSRGTSSARAG